MSRNSTYIFGPVPSRRLGRSLGVDVIPRKLCTLDCVYCELGPTEKRSLRRKEYTPSKQVVEQVKSFLATHEAVDIITFSGSGEPTLHSGIGAMIGALKEWTTIPIAVLTNGTLLYREDVRRDLLEADIVLPSLDAVTNEIFRLVNRPHPQLHLGQILDGMRTFRREFRGRIWLEILLVQGLNDSEEEAALLKEIVREINPDKIQLNTVTRPPVHPAVRPVSSARLRELELFFGDRCEAIGTYDPRPGTRDVVDSTEVLAVLQRRPMTLQELGQSMQAPLDVLLLSLSALERNSQVFSFIYRGKKYYRAFESTGYSLSI